MGSSSLLDSFGDAVSQSGRSSRHHQATGTRRHKKRRSHSPSTSRSRSRDRSRDRERDRDRSRSRSRTRGFFGGGEGGSGHRRSTGSRGSFFGVGGGNHSRSSFFGNSRPSYYKRSPREGFVQRCIKQLKRLLRDLQHYAKRHPWKVFFLVILPLVTGGALTALLARFGLRIPPALERMLSVAKRAATGDPFSAVGDAVRMAGEYGHHGQGSLNPSAYAAYAGGAGGSAIANGGHAYASSASRSGATRVERRRSGDVRWERRATTYYDERDREGGFMDGIRKGVSKMFS
ncbi:uncharacterized protein TRIREDRAFT_76539 [Trichoderma reesei QM6a]|uniref:Predicted protein n=2 Tax=Hypocrea jecorina TaxID=51453 RepID=G0RFH1_HYPJQ|nr:uncharacterized protein TRIREDRAFT_76539 [Trichoderma reesei QM6a]EGR50474.1 predicted protein [Trichoderma reesei QM6a]ETS03999.1 hypothetical protein M419DRAFT_140716 [Trichoderma reesei RUT C-30]